MKIELRSAQGLHLSDHRTLSSAFAAVAAEEKRFKAGEHPGQITAEVRIFVDGEEKTAEWIGDGYCEVSARQAALDAEAGV